MKTSFAVAATAVVSLSLAQPALGQSDANKLGTVNFETLGDQLTAIVFSGMVPGTGEEAQKHDVVDKVFKVRADDLLLAIANAHKKAASRA